MQREESLRQVPHPLQERDRPLPRRGRRRGHVHHPVRQGRHQEEGHRTARPRWPCWRRATSSARWRSWSACRARPRAEMVEEGDLIVIGGDVFGDMIKSQPRDRGPHAAQVLDPPARDDTKQIEQMASAVRRARSRRWLGSGGQGAPPPPATAAGRGASPTSSRSPPATSSRCSRPTRCIGRYDSVTGMSARGRPHATRTRAATSRGGTRAS